MAKFKLEELKKIYDRAKDVDSHIFSEQRTNILLKMGDHYKKGTKSTLNNLRQRGVISNEQKIRLTKNHIHRITNVYENSILDGNPSITAVPYNESELHDTKTAELNNAVLSWVKNSNNWKARQHRNVSDFVTIGEVFAKIRFDYDKGPIVGKDEHGKPVKAGEFVIDRAYAFDMKRDPEARDSDEARYWIHEETMDLKGYKKLVKRMNPDAVDKIVSSQNQTLKIFDTTTGKFAKAKDRVLVKELFIKPGSVIDGTTYDDGLYVMFTDKVKVHEMPLPFGIYPIITKGFDELPTSPRSASIIRVCRPYQVEVNRAGSKMAEHQITLGDDKVFIQKGTKISNGGYVHGVRAFQVSGQSPVIQPGRNGSQYLEYGLAQVKEMYDACDLGYVLEDKQTSGDPYQLLFQTMRQKKRFVKYVERYEQFEVEVFSTILKMAKHYLSPHHMIKIAGRTEMINIDEFKRIDEMGFEIKAVAQSGDIEEKFGKMLSITQTLQYAGSSLQPDQLGVLIKQLPYANQEQIFSTLTVDTDNAENTILSLDRGQYLPVLPSENHTMMLKALNHRMKKSDYRFMPDNIQQMYQARIQEHQAFFENERQKIEQAKMGMVPTGGFLTTVNASWFNPTTKRVERIKIPSQSVQWLVDKLQTQGVFNAELEGLPDNVQAQIGEGSQTLQAPTTLPGLQPKAEEQNIGGL